MTASAASHYCHSCGSPAPERHPHMGFDGPVVVCADAFHKAPRRTFRSGERVEIQNERGGTFRMLILDINGGFVARQDGFASYQAAIEAAQ